MLGDKSVKDFLKETASKEPVPGGGSVAALSAGIASALTEMVANLTVGKKGYEDVQDEMEAIIKIVEEKREEFVADIDRDAEAFNKVMEAFRLPKNSDSEKETRKLAIQDSFKHAANVPFEIAEKSFSIMESIEKVVEKGNQNAVTDGAVAAMMTRTAVLSALYNVKINLGSIKDEAYVNKLTKEVNDLERRVKEVEERILQKVQL